MCDLSPQPDIPPRDSAYTRSEVRSEGFLEKRLSEGVNEEVAGELSTQRRESAEQREGGAPRRGRRAQAPGGARMALGGGGAGRGGPGWD